MKHILILRGGALGDFIVTLPLLVALRRHMPDAVLHLAARPAYAGLAMAFGLAHDIIPIESARMSGFFCDKPVFSQEESDFIRSLELVVNFLPDKDGVVQGNMRNLGLRQWLDIPPSANARHVSDHFLNIAVGAGLISKKYAALIPCLEIGSDSKQRARSRLENLTHNAGPWAFIHPGSGSDSKNWPVENFIETARALANKLTLQPVFLTGEADTAVMKQLEKHGMPYPVLENSELRDLAAAISLGNFYLGNDSGVSHLAAILGIRTLTLFGPTDPVRWAPRGKHTRVVRSVPATAEGIKRMPSCKVIEEILRFCANLSKGAQAHPKPS